MQTKLTNEEKLKVEALEKSQQEQKEITKIKTLAKKTDDDKQLAEEQNH